MAKIAPYSPQVVFGSTWPLRLGVAAEMPPRQTRTTLYNEPASAEAFRKPRRRFIQAPWSASTNPARCDSTPAMQTRAGLRCAAAGSLPAPFPRRRWSESKIGPILVVDRAGPITQARTVAGTQMQQSIYQNRSKSSLSIVLVCVRSRAESHQLSTYVQL
jgi:hypothetical protein